MRISVFGGLHIHTDDGHPIPLSVGKQRQLVAILLCQRNRYASVGTLLDLLWGVEPPVTARGGLQVQVHRLRRVWDPERVLSRDNGYQLVVLDGELDSDRFEGLVRTGSGALRSGDDNGARAAFSEALRLCGGEPYEGIAELGVIRAEADRLGELKLEALEGRAEAELRLGRHTELVSELSVLVNDHPLRETFAAQLMLALYRSGRAAEALEVYQRAYAASTSSFGAEPGLRLAELQRAILTEDPTLDLAPQRRGTDLTTHGSYSPVAIRVPAELPTPSQSFTGRDAELARLCGLLTDTAHPGRVVTISGPGGVGKSALATQVAGEVAGHYPDGRLYVNLHGATPGREPLPPAEVLRRFLRSLGYDDKMRPNEMPEAVRLYRESTATSRVLVVLDDAADVEQVEPLLPDPSHGSAALITGRRATWRIPRAVRLTLSELDESESLRLLVRLVGEQRVLAEPEAAAQIIRSCGRLPLALRVAGARLAARRDWRLWDFAERLADTQGRLDELEYADLAVRTSCAVGYSGLGESAGELVRLLGTLDINDVSIPAAAALTDRPIDEVGADLEQLAEAQLLQVSAGRYSMHDLLRLYARERAVEELDPDVTDGAWRRVLHWYLCTARAANYAINRDVTRAEFGLSPDRVRRAGLTFDEPSQAAEWVRAEAANLVAMARQAAGFTQECAALAGLAPAAVVPLTSQGLWVEAIAVSRAGLTGAQACGDRGAEAMIRNDLGAVRFGKDSLDEAREQLDRSRAIFAELGHPGETRALGNIGIVLREQERLDEAYGVLEQAYERATRAEWVTSARAMAQEMARIRTLQGRIPEAIELCRQALARLDGACADSLGSTVDLHRALLFAGLADARRAGGDLPGAITELERAVGLAWRLGHYHREVVHRWALADALFAADRVDAALTRWREALRMLEDLGFVSREQGEALLAAGEPPEKPEILRVDS